MFFVGLDLGQTTDHTAVAMVEAIERKNEQPEYRLHHLERLPLRTSYPEIVAYVRKGMAQLKEADLVVDCTGVGRPVVDMFRHHDVYPVAVTITGGSAQTKDDATGEWHVPKRALVSTLQILLQSGRLKVAKRIKDADAFKVELLNFKFKVSQSAHTSFDAKSGEHDDLVMAAALACWRAMRLLSDSFAPPDDTVSDPGAIVEAKHTEWLQAMRKQDEWL